jgi:hypothetical protein
VWLVSLAQLGTAKAVKTKNYQSHVKEQSKNY